MSGRRLPSGGDAIDRAQPIRFTFNGRPLTGYAGDTLASALLANGVSTVGRSFKYHRPRGVIAAGVEETNALAQLEDGALSAPNIPATQIAIYSGLAARSVNCWPSPEFDLGAINSTLKSFLPAGFYYKMFMWPSWRLFEPFIRHAAGLGRAPSTPDPERYDIQHLTIDKAIVGAGEAGRRVAASSGDGGRVLLIDRGQISPLDNVRTLPRTTVIAHLDGGLLIAVEDIAERPARGALRQRLWKIRALEIIYATGGYERPLIFANNDLPGIMLAGAVGDYVTHYGAAPGKRILIATNNDGAYALADICRGAGIEIAAIVDYRTAGREGAINGVVRQAIGNGGVKSAEISLPDGRIQRIDCDTIAMSGGWTPSLELFLQAGGTIRRSAANGAITADRAAPGVSLAVRDFPEAGSTIPEEILSSPTLAKTSFIDFQTDVTLADIALAVQENYRAPDHLKRYTTLGMGTDQGKLSALNGSEALARLSGAPIECLLPTKTRPPVTPTAFGALAAGQPPGALWRPRKYLPAHDLHARLGATFDDSGWQRPSHYPQGGEVLEQAAAREALGVRQAAGLFDASPLGKIELKGPGAAAFLDHVYVGTMSSLKPGRIRYGLMLNENGSIIDDGVCMRLGDDHFLINASSGHADRISSWLNELHQCEWPFDFAMQDVTANWATWALAGPKAVAILDAAGVDIDISRAAFPHLSVREARVAGAPARIARVSFSGEVCFEISVGADVAGKVGAALLDAGRLHGLTPYGIEALEILRIEKGYIHVSSDTDSETQPADIGLGAKIAHKTSDFIGRRSLMRPHSTAAGRKQLVGLVSEDHNVVLPMGAHLVGESGRSVGFVGSSCFSPTLARGIALALLENGRNRLGEKITVYSMGENWTATISAPAFFDPDGARLHE